MSSSQPWADRRGLFPRGREVHEPAPARRPSQTTTADAVIDALAKTMRRASTASDTSSGGGAALERKTSNTAMGESPRRRSSAASGLFANLQQHKRGSDDYQTRRASHVDQHVGNSPGLFSGWYNSTFRGIAGTQGEERRGTME